MNETLIVLLSIGYFLATLSLIAAVVFLIVVSVELRRGINVLKDFLNSTKSRLDPAITETEKAIKGIRVSIEDINEVTGKMRLLSETIERLGLIVSEVVGSLDKLKSSLSLKSSALKTAISVAASVFLENLKKGGKKNE